MMQRSVLLAPRTFLLIFFLSFLSFATTRAQDYQKVKILLNLTPGYTWFQTDNPRDLQTTGGTFGYNAGMKVTIFFQKNYAFTTGLFYLHTGGKITYNDTVTLMLQEPMEVPGGTKIVYSINYLSIPVGIRLHTVAFGYWRYYFEPGMNVLFNLSAKAGVPAFFNGKESCPDEINLFNLAFYVDMGAIYSIGGGTALTGGITYMRGLMDMTGDAAGKPGDKLVFNSLGLKLGIIF